MLFCFQQSFSFLSYPPSVPHHSIGSFPDIAEYKTIPIRWCFPNPNSFCLWCMKCYWIVLSPHHEDIKERLFPCPCSLCRQLCAKGWVLSTASLLNQVHWENLRLARSAAAVSCPIYCGQRGGDFSFSQRGHGGAAEAPILLRASVPVTEEASSKTCQSEWQFTWTSQGQWISHSGGDHCGQHLNTIDGELGH